MSKSAQMVTAAVLVLCILLLYAINVDAMHVYTLRDDNGGTVLWDDNQAYLFMSVVRRGYRTNFLKFPLVLLMGLFGVVPVPTNERVFLYVIHVTPSGVERRLALTTTQTAGIPSSFTPVGQTIYTFCNGSLCKWGGDRFESATLEEQKSVGGIDHLMPDVDATSSGWTKRGIGSVAGEFNFSIKIGSQITLKIREGNVYNSLTDSPSIDLVRAGELPQSLWHIDGSPRRVSKKVYERELTGLAGYSR